jgi:hypothetical protein
MKPRPKKRLELVSETLRSLWNDVLGCVHGGDGNPASNMCNSFICSIGRDCHSIGCDKP